MDHKFLGLVYTYDIKMDLPDSKGTVTLSVYKPEWMITNNWDKHGKELLVCFIKSS